MGGKTERQPAEEAMAKLCINIDLTTDIRPLSCVVTACRRKECSQEGLLESELSMYLSPCKQTARKHVSVSVSPTCCLALIKLI